MSEERLQKILARAGIASRRKAEELIRDGRVTINGRIAEIGDKADLEHDAVKMDARRIQAPTVHRYLLLNKPRGVMSTVSDPAGRPTVIDLVPPALRRALAPVGRLDFHTEGLLLLTDDGDLAQQVAHPSHGCWKTYEVKVRGRPDEEQIRRLRAGIVLEGRRTAPCHIATLRRRPPTGPRRGAATEGDTSSWWSVELGEGRTRQIREMFQRIGHPVQKLRRVAIGPISDPAMPVGMLRELSDREVTALRKAGPPAPRKAPAAGPARRSEAGAGSVPTSGGGSGDLPAVPPGVDRPAAKRAAPRRSGPPAREEGAAEVLRRASGPAESPAAIGGRRPVRAAGGAARSLSRPAGGAGGGPTRGVARGGEKLSRGSGRGAAGGARPSRPAAGIARGARGSSQAGGGAARSARGPSKAGGGAARGAPRAPGRAAAGVARGEGDRRRAGGGASRGEGGLSRAGGGLGRSVSRAPSRAAGGVTRGGGMPGRDRSGGAAGGARPRGAGGGSTRGARGPGRAGGATRGAGASRGGGRGAGGRGGAGSGGAGGRGAGRPRRGGRG